MTGFRQRSKLSVCLLLSVTVVAFSGWHTALADEPTKSWPFSVPVDTSIPTGPLGDSIKLGREVVNNTQRVAKSYVGNGLNCTSCHLSGGTVAGASPFVGLWGVFPEYHARSASVGALQDRVNDCFLRSMNGKALPVDSPEMLGVLSYIGWLSQGVPTGMSSSGRGFVSITAPAAADAKNGEAIYAQKCAACHGAGGGGVSAPEGGYIAPPLWGAASFNIGAGMARLNTAAAFVKHKMPLGQGGTLTDQEAFDVAAYFTTQPRPDFAAAAKDWPKGDKPKDARN
jgi:thiosulfate dehydrogenase